MGQEQGGFEKAAGGLETGTYTATDTEDCWWSFVKAHKDVWLVFFDLATGPAHSFVKSSSKAGFKKRIDTGKANAK